MIQFIQHHLIPSLLGGYFLFSNFVGAMETPTEKNGSLYRYVYRFGHSLAGNMKYALKAKFPEYVEPEQK